MTRTGLIDKLAERFPQLEAADAEQAVRMILDAMTDALSRGNRIGIRGFRSFHLSYRPPRVARNPMTGEKVNAPEKYSPHSRNSVDCHRCPVQISKVGRLSERAA